METQLRRATPADLQAMLAIVAEAQAFMKSQGLDQWQNGYPGIGVLRADIDAGNAWLLCLGDEVVATAALCFGEEEDYRLIYEGDWGAHGPYAAIHRVAIGAAHRGGGLAGTLFQGLQARCDPARARSIRIDTHRDNLPMQRFLAKNGFVRRGVIFLGTGAGGEAGAERIAYDKLL